MTDKPELKISANQYDVPFSAHWDEMGWPLPDLTDGEHQSIQWKLRYAQEHLTHSEALGAAWMIAAYHDLIMLPSSKRTKIASVLKKLTETWYKTVTDQLEEHIEKARQVVSALESYETRLVIADNDNYHLVRDAINVIYNMGTELDSMRFKLNQNFPKCGLNHPWACVECGETL